MEGKSKIGEELEEFRKSGQVGEGNVRSMSREGVGRRG